jgi:RecA/RadA recombinase
MDLKIIKKELLFCGYDLENLSDTEIIDKFNTHCTNNMVYKKVGDIINDCKDKFICIDTPDGFQEISTFFIKKERPIYELTLSNNSKCKSSNDHLYETVQGWKKTENLSESDLILTKDNFIKIDNIVNTGTKEIVYDWTVEHENQRYWAGLQGISSHNSGKTFLTLNAVKNAQLDGYTPIYYDTEGAIDATSCRNFGIDLNNFRWEPVSEIEKLKTMYAIFIKSLTQLKLKGKEIPKFLLILDSVGMLASSKEIEDAKTGNSAADMTRAKQIRSFFRIITSDLNSLGIPMIFTNHTMVNIGGYGDPVVQGGGGGVVYSPSITLYLSKAKLKDDKDDDKKQTGVIVTAKTGKNRFAQPKTIKFPIFFTKPFNRYMGVQDYLKWETVGIAKGSILTEKEYAKLKEPEKSKVHQFSPDNSTEIMYFAPKETSRKWVIKHLGEMIDAKQLFTDRVMLPLEDLFDEVIKKDFEFSTQELDDEISDILDSDEDDDIDSVEI